MSDLISRADAIDAVAEEWLSEASAESPYVNDYDIDKYRELAEDLFADIPSADALLKQDIDFHKKVSRIEAEKVVDLEHKLADMVSVVRCKDCIHYEKHDTWSACTYWSGNPYEQASVIDDDFCSYGERAEQTEYKLPGHDEVMGALDKMKLEFTINGKERIKRIGGDND